MFNNSFPAAAVVIDEQIKNESFDLMRIDISNLDRDTAFIQDGLLWPDQALLLHG